MPYYTEPINSPILDVFVLENLSLNLDSGKVSDIKKKMMVLELHNVFIAMPIIHTVSFEE